MARADSGDIAEQFEVVAPASVSDANYVDKSNDCSHRCGSEKLSELQVIKWGRGGGIRGERLEI